MSKSVSFAHRTLDLGHWTLDSRLAEQAPRLRREIAESATRAAAFACNCIVDLAGNWRRQFILYESQHGRDGRPSLFFRDSSFAYYLFDEFVHCCSPFSRRKEGRGRKGNRGKGKREWGNGERENRGTGKQGKNQTLYSPCSPIPPFPLFPRSYSHAGVACPVSSCQKGAHARLKCSIAMFAFVGFKVSVSRRLGLHVNRLLQRLRITLELRVKIRKLLVHGLNGFLRPAHVFRFLHRTADTARRGRSASQRCKTYGLASQKRRKHSGAK